MRQKPKKSFFVSVMIILLTIFTILGCSQDVMNPLFGMGNKLDSEYPKLKITSPKASSLLPRYFTITGTTSDDMGVDTLTIVAKNKAGNEAINITMNPDSKWSTNIDAIGLDDGSNKFIFTLRDKSGNTVREELSLTIDKTAPEIKVFSPDLSGYANGNIPEVSGVLNFYGFVSDSYSGVKPKDPENWIRLYKESDPSSFLINEALDNGDGLWQTDVSVDTLTKPEGVYVLEILFKDKLGNPQNNTSQIWKMNMKQENDHPSLILQNPTPGASNSFETSGLLPISGIAKDNRGLKKVDYVLNNSSGQLATQGSLPASGLQYAFSTVLNLKSTIYGPNGLPDDMYTLIVTAWDEDLSRTPPMYSSPQAVVSISLSNDVPSFDILTKTTSPVGKTPEALTYLNSSFYLTTKTLTSTAGMSYEIVQNGSVKKSGSIDYTGSNNICETAVPVSISGLSDGAIDVYFIARGANGKEYKVSRIYYIDQTPPTVKIITPEPPIASKPGRYNGPLKIEGNASDGNSIDKVHFKLSTAPDIASSWKLMDGTSHFSYEYATDANGGDLESLHHVDNGNTFDVTFDVRATDIAGNYGYDHLGITIDPETDYPVLSLISPVPFAPGPGKDNTSDSKYQNLKYSGMLTIAATLEDDDFPPASNRPLVIASPMSAKVEIFKYGTTTKVFSSPEIKNNMNVIPTPQDLSAAPYEDGQKYTIKITAKDWHNMPSNTIELDFQVDQNVPRITLDSVTDYQYRTNEVTLSGVIEDENEVKSAKISFTTTGANKEETFDVKLTQTQTANPPSVLTNKYTYNIVLKKGGGHTGFDTALGKKAATASDLSWGDNEWGNSPQRFRISATDQTGLEGSRIVTVNMDNHTPKVSTLTTKVEGVDVQGTEAIPYLLKNDSNGNVTIYGTASDLPSAGVVYPLGLTNNIRITRAVKNAGSFINETEVKPYGDNCVEGSGFSITGTFASFTMGWRPPAGFLDGVYRINVYAKDNALNETTIITDGAGKNVGTFVLQLDQNPPYITDVSLVYPTSNQVAYTGKIKYKVTAQDSGNISDTNNGIVKLEMYVDNETSPRGTQSYTPADNSAVSHTFELDTSLFPDNVEHVLKFVATDKITLNKVIAYSPAMIFDNSAPKISEIAFHTKDYVDSSGKPKNISAYSSYLTMDITIEDDFGIDTSKKPDVILTAKRKSGSSVLPALLPISLDSQLFNLNSTYYQVTDKKYTMSYSVPIDLFEILAANYDEYDKLTMKIFVQDRVGIGTYYTYDTDTNTIISVVEAPGSNATVANIIKPTNTDLKTYINRGDGVTLTVGKPDYSYIGPNNDDDDANTTQVKIAIGGSGAGGTERKLFVEIDGTTTKTIPLTTANPFSTYLTLNPGEIADGIHTFKFRLIAGEGIQKELTKTFYIDTTAPTLVITSVAAVPDSGYVNGSNISGKVRISGTYEDAHMGSMSIAQADIKLSLDGAVVPVDSANIDNATGGAWIFTYDWDTEGTGLAALVKNSIQIFATAKDLTDNKGQSANAVKNIVPYITDIVGNTAKDLVYPVRSYNGTIWANHNLEFSTNRKQQGVTTGVQIQIRGYNLKGSGNTTVSLAGTALTVESSTKQSVVARLAPTTSISGTVVLTAIGSNTTQANSATLYVWEGNRVGGGYATNDPGFIDMDLDNFGKAVFSYYRNHKVSGYESDDYATYRIKEEEPTAYRTINMVDPCFFSSVVFIPGNTGYSTRDGRGQLFIASCIDEWGTPSYTFFVEMDYTFNIGDTVFQSTSGNSGSPTQTGRWKVGLNKSGSSLNTAKYGSMSYYINGNGMRYIYTSIYDDDSRETGPNPRILIDVTGLGTGGTNTGTPHNLTIKQTQAAGDILFPATDVDVTNGGNLIYSYATKNNGLKLGSIACTTTASLGAGLVTPSLTGTEYTTSVDSAGNGQDNSLVSRYYTSAGAYANASSVHVAYQTTDGSLKYAYVTGYDGSSPVVNKATLELYSNEGLTGGQTAIDLDKTQKPHITYLNKSKINTKEALRYAFYTGTANSATELSDPSKWKYMVVPSEVMVNLERTRVRAPYSGENKVVVGYRGENFIYIIKLK